MSSLATAALNFFILNALGWKCSSRFRKIKNQVPMGMDKEASLWLHSRQPLG